MSNFISRSLKIVSLIALAIALTFCAMQIAGYVKMKNQDGASDIHLYLAFATFLPFVIAFLFHRRSKFLIAIIFSILSIFLPKLYTLI